MSSVEYYGFLLIFLAGVYFALRFALSVSRSAGNVDVVHRSQSLLEAVAGRRPAEVKQLLAGAVDLDTRDDHGETPLMLAVRNNDLDSARLLIAKGADIFAENRRGQTAWDVVAALNVADGTVGFYAGMQRLLEGERDVPARLLLLACRRGDLDLARHALDIGAAVDARDYFVHRRDMLKGATALMLAVEGGHLEIVRLLVREGADIHFDCGWDNAPSTALQVALAGDHHAIVEFLLLQSALRRAAVSAYGTEQRVEKQLNARLDALPLLHPAPAGARRSRRQVAAAVHAQDCAEILPAPGRRDGRRLCILLAAVCVEEAEGQKLRARWLEIERVGEDEFVCNEFESVGAAGTPVATTARA